MNYATYRFYLSIEDVREGRVGSGNKNGVCGHHHHNEMENGDGDRDRDREMGAKRQDGLFHHLAPRLKTHLHLEPGYVFIK